MNLPDYEHGFTALHVAAPHKGDTVALELVRALVEHGGDWRYGRRGRWTRPSLASIAARPPPPSLPIYRTHSLARFLR